MAFWKWAQGGMNLAVVMNQKLEEKHQISAAANKLLFKKHLFLRLEEIRS
jgi:hypothetical protein